MVRESGGVCVVFLDLQFRLVIEQPVQDVGRVAVPDIGFCPPVLPRARAAARPSRVRSDIRACSNSAIEPRIWKNMRPMAVDVSMPWSRTTRSTPRACSVLDKSMRFSSDRPSRSSLVTTS